MKEFSGGRAKVKSKRERLSGKRRNDDGRRQRRITFEIEEIRWSGRNLCTLTCFQLDCQNILVADQSPRGYISAVVRLFGKVVKQYPVLRGSPAVLKPIGGVSECSRHTKMSLDCALGPLAYTRLD